MQFLMGSLVSEQVKKFWKSVSIWRTYDRNLVVNFFNSCCKAGSVV